MTIKKEILVKLYLERHRSVAEIAKELNCSIYKVRYWMEIHKICCRERSEANYHKYNPNGDPFQIRKINTLKKTKLYALSIGLFWGEGNKRNKHSVRIGNSDPIMLSYWLKFLKDICGIASSKIHFDLQTFNDTDPTNARDFWSQQLQIPAEKIGTCQPVSPQGKGNYKL